MTPQSVLRRGALVTVAAASAIALTACGAGQVSQTANQVAAVDGAQNPQESNPGGVAVRDAHILVNPEKATAALKFSAINQERANDVTYTLKKITIDGIGDVDLKKVSETDSYKKLAKGDKEIPRNCSLIADSAESVKEFSKGADGTNACAVYMSNDLKADKLVNETMNATGKNHNATFVFDGPQGEEKVDLFVTISADIAPAGSMDRKADGETLPEKSAKKDSMVEPAETAAPHTAATAS